MDFKDDPADLEKYALKDIPDPYERLVEQMKDTLNDLTAPAGQPLKPVEELTKLEKVAIFWAAGVQMGFSAQADNGIVCYETKQPCGISIKDRAYHVFIGGGED